MSKDLDPLVADLVAWVDAEPRLYCDLLEAWRTSCPRLTVWEDAQDRGFVSRVYADGQIFIVATAAGRRFVATHGRQRLPSAASA